MTSFEVAVTHVTRINTMHHKCNEDPEYDVVQCFERCAQEKAGCASPWDISPSKVNKLTRKIVICNDWHSSFVHRSPYATLTKTSSNCLG